MGGWPEAPGCSGHPGPALPTPRPRQPPLSNVAGGGLLGPPESPGPLQIALFSGSPPSQYFLKRVLESLSYGDG